VRVLSCRVDDDVWLAVERARIEAGQNRTEWLRSQIGTGIANAQIAPPDPTAVAFCQHPDGKRIGTYCVGCNTNLGAVLPGAGVAV
jgi:hypothetical protein